MKFKPKNLSWIIGSYLLISILLFSFSVLVVTYYNANLSIEKERQLSLEHRHTLVDGLFEAQLDRLEFALKEIKNHQSFSTEICLNPSLDKQALLQSISKENTISHLDILLLSRIDGNLCLNASSQFFSLEHVIPSIINMSTELYAGQIRRFKTDSVDLIIMLKAIPIINRQTGELLGMMIGGQVLNNNLSMLELIRQKTKSETVGFFSNKNIIGSTDLLTSNSVKLLVSDIKSTSQGELYYNSNLSSPFSEAKLTTSYRRVVIKGGSNDLVIGLATKDITLLSMRNTFGKSGLYLLFSLILFFALTIYAVSKITIPSLKNLLDYSKEVSAGRIKTIYKHSNVTEFNKIGLAMEGMVSNLNTGREKLIAEIAERKTAETKIKKLNIELDQRVKQRTAEIVNVNQQLTDKIIDYKKTEIELLKFFQAVQQTGSSIVITDSDGTIEFVNPSFSQTTGYSSKEAIGQTPNILNSGQHPHEFYTNMWKTISSGDTWQSELINKKKSGELFWESATISAVKNSSDKIINYIAIKDNISTRKEMESQLLQAKENADVANQSKSEFLANMSHELRTPLNSIIGFSQVLEDQILKDLTEKQQKYFNFIKDGGNHLLELVNDILDLAKIESGKIETEMKPFNFGEMLERSPSIIQTTAYKKDLKLKISIKSDLGWLNGDETKIKQVIFNLLSNAMKFTEPGNNIGLDARVDGDNFNVTVWDEGIGIPEESLKKIFDPFEQVKGAKISKEKGTGLGLAISKKLIELHHGTITVTSKLGAGSRFIVVLPGRISTEETVSIKNRTKQNAIDTGVARDLKILVTEDNAGNRAVVKAALKQYNLDFAVTGEKAVTMASEKEYDLILMDIQLPGIDGVETLQQIRKNSKKYIPAIAVTAFAMKGNKQKYLDKGFDNYISKPLNLALLRKKINEQ